jgi:hypothetical protein
MHVLLNRLGLLLLSVFLIGCATREIKTPTKPTPDSGALVLSIAALKGFNMSSTSVFLRRVADKTGVLWPTLLQLDPLFFPDQLDIKDKDIKVEVLVAYIPPGEYEAYTWEMSNTGYMARYRYRSKQEFSIPFRINPGQTTYIGQYAAADFGFTAPTGSVYPNPEFFVSDEMTRDMEIAQKKYPTLQLGVATNASHAAKNVRAGSIKFVEDWRALK